MSAVEETFAAMQAQLRRLEIAMKALLLIAQVAHRRDDPRIYGIATGAIEAIADVRQSQQESLHPGNLPTQSQ